MPRSPLSHRTAASATLLLFEALLLAIVYFVLALLPGGPLRTPAIDEGVDLPARESLSTAEGRIVNLGQHTSRRRQYLKPVVEFTVDGTAYRVRTLRSYSQDLIPFRSNQQVARVLYERGRPQSAWLEWEYDRFRRDHDGLASDLTRTFDRLRAGYATLSLAVLGLTALLLAVNLFVPLVGRADR